MDRYAGTYASTTSSLKVTISRDGNTLKAQATGQGPLVLEALRKDVYTFAPAGILVEFDPAKPTFRLKQSVREDDFVKE